MAEDQSLRQLGQSDEAVEVRASHSTDHDAAALSIGFVERAATAPAGQGC